MAGGDTIVAVWLLLALCSDFVLLWALERVFDMSRDVRATRNIRERQDILRTGYYEDEPGAANRRLARNGLSRRPRTGSPSVLEGAS